LILTSDLTLEAVLGGAVSANQPEFHVDYIVRDNSANPVPKPATLRGALNSTTDVTLLSPSTGRYSTQGFVAEVLRLSIYNKDTASVTVTVKTTDGTDRIICQATLSTTETLVYTKEGQWYVMTSDGAIKNNAISYAEGSWTPADGSGANLTFTSVTARYEKIGRQVRASFSLTYPATADGSSAIISGLPFANANQLSETQGFISFTNEATAQQICQTGGNSTTAQILTDAGAAVTNATMSGNSIRGTLLYSV
jgi:hypothetical protein